MIIMKNKSFLLFILLGISITSFSQEENDTYNTLFKNNGKTSVSGFGGLMMEFSGMDNQFAFSMGGGGAVLFNQSFFFGGYGLGTVNFPNYTYPQPTLNDDNKSILFGHGGFYTGFIFSPNKPVHIGISSKFGWGAITIMDDIYKNYNYPYPYDDYIMDFIFVITPQVEAEFNIAKWFKVNMGLGYRITTGVDETYIPFNSTEEVPYFDSNAFNSATFQIGLYFGWFK